MKGILMAKAPKAVLLDEVAPRYAEVDADHVTLRFKVAEREVSHWVGRAFKARVTGEAWNDEIQAVRVELPYDLAQLCENDHPHITISRRPGVGAKHSNAMLEAPAHEAPLEFELDFRVVFERFK